MKVYKIIEHTADIKLRVEAETLEELFVAALEGMNKVLSKDYEKKLNKHVVAHEISLASSDITTLLIDFLSNVLTLSHLDKAIFYDLALLEIEENRLHAHLIGAKVGEFTEDIKAVTYHQAEIKKNEKGNLETVIVFDV